MTFNHINRRLHLYLALALLPWIVVYALSAIPFTRNAYFNALYKDGIPQWTTRFEQAYDRPVPETRTDKTLRAFGAQTLSDLGIRPASIYVAYRANAQRINIYLYDFWNQTRLTYYVADKRIKIEDKRFRWDHFFTSLHARGGFQQDAFLSDTWAAIVDLVSIGFILWVASGIVMWWQLKQTRIWGAIALGGGALSFVIFLFAL